MSFKSSRLLMRLDADIAAATDPVALDCLRAERASYLARQGDLDEAAQVLDAIRLRHAGRPHAALNAWVSLAEGLVIHFTDLDPRSRDKLLRAYAISTFADLKPIRAQAAAWLAQAELLAGNAESLATHARTALDLAADGAPSAALRIHLVIGMALHLADRLDAAQPWYEQARRAASELGDTPAVGALLSNSTWLQAWNWRLAPPSDADPEATAQQIRRLVMNAESSLSFDRMAGTTGLQNLGPLLRGFVAAIEGDDALALTHYEHALAGTNGAGRPIKSMVSVFRADHAACLARLGRLDDARTQLGLIEAAGVAAERADCRVLIGERLADVHVLLGRSDAAARWRDLAETARIDHAAYRERLVEALAKEQIH